MTNSTLTGILVPDQWTENGEISGFALCTNDEQKYVLNCTADKKNLMGMLHQTIKVVGFVTDDAGERNIIATTCYLLSFDDKKQHEAKAKTSFSSGITYLKERARIETFFW